MRRVVIVGGGVGGAFTANKLATKAFAKVKKGELEVVVVEPEENVVYQPGFLYVPFKELPSEVMFRPVRKVLHPLVNLVKKPATKIDVKNRKVVLGDGSEIQYDYLVLATGAVVKTDHFPGFKKVWHTFWTYEGAKALREALSKFAKGTLVFSVASTPFKCPVAPYEFLFYFDDVLMKTGRKKDVKIVFTTVAPHLHAQPNVNKFLEEEFRNRGIEYRTKFEVKEVREGEVVGPETLKGDLIIVVPKHTAAEVAFNSGLVDQGGWVPVDKYTLQIAGGNGVEYAIGDTTNLAVPKAGSVAHFQSEVVADRIYEDMEFGHADSVYNGRVICFILTGTEEATQVSWNYDGPALYPVPSNKFMMRLKDLTNFSIWSAVRCGL
ncbi:NAD(P)/FAD-dependent oxidoreductase [Pyrobaculum calidifontis]|uniref:FAD-dependent pyridine nucleotide-disulfide oxidoreductase n=1 Tax=Pyrobaculum calidifontis (strain DSM 21063 / JCM 11548 / VA1) TaxID=410359 RepID=A3MW41_PYRCJ|nr:FAD/NAD(P)-binding oxidoreductase [Pyrobaculum calidifontis]ABO08858.1 FAD-dependent pyridine nucleotide-disulfide oxidoreductase [Pyrobaculum calidifontis JCM 11548]